MRSLALPHFVDTQFQILFTPLTGVLFHLSLAVLYAIGYRLVFRLGEWSPRIQSEFHVFRPTWDTSRLTINFAYGGFTLYAGPFQILLLSIGLAVVEVPQPRSVNRPV